MNEIEFKNKKTEEMLSYYRKGVSLKDIGEKMRLPLPYIQHLLLYYKEMNKLNKRIFNKDFKRTIAERYQNDVDRKTISDELNISNSLISSSNSQYEFHEKKCKFVRNYELYSTYVELDKCPFCNSTNNHKIKTIAEILLPGSGTLNCKPTEGIYCKNCSNEFFYFAEDVNKDIYLVTDDM